MTEKIFNEMISKWNKLNLPKWMIYGLHYIVRSNCNKASEITTISSVYNIEEGELFDFYCLMRKFVKHVNNKDKELKLIGEVFYE